MRRLDPERYQQERHRVTARFDEAVQLAEQAFTDELAKLVSHLAERLSGSGDGKPKVFRDTAVENRSEFFERFRSLNIGNIRCVYGEAIDLTALGSLTIARGSHVEPTEYGRWTADLSPAGGPVL